MHKLHLTLVFWAAMTLGVTSCSDQINIDKQLDVEADIYPDYKDVTIPPNIAPLNISVNSENNGRLIIEGNGMQITVKSKKGNFNIPETEWHRLLEACKGGEIKFTVCEEQSKQWIAYLPFRVTVAKEPIDKYVVYRLIPPDYELWNQMGIYQRNLEDFEQTAIFENKQADFNCVNCHSFQQGSPSTFMLHARETHPGTIIVKNGQAEKLDTKTDKTISALVYSYWHPSGRYIAFSTNSTSQAFHAYNDNRVEVYDAASDVVVYDVEKHLIISNELLRSEMAFETFPSFSADGRSLYFCSAKAVDNMPDDYQDVHYNLCRIDFDAETGTFGQRVDTLYNAAADTMSVSFPRESPDGKFIAFTLHKYGNFSIWHQEADLYNLNLETLKAQELSAANSSRIESYHSWSSNSRWMTFSSRRDDGLYTRPYISYIDEQGQAHKAFMLPQHNPRQFNQSLMLSYNIPELITDKVTFSSNTIEQVMKNNKSAKVTYKE